MDGATPTAVIVPVTAAEPVVAAHRRRFDVAASWGVPAHVTVLYPFVDPAGLDEATLARLAAAVAFVQAFDCVFARTAPTAASSTTSSRTSPSARVGSGRRRNSTPLNRTYVRGYPSRCTSITWS